MRALGDVDLQARAVGFGGLGATRDLECRFEGKRVAADDLEGARQVLVEANVEVSVRVRRQRAAVGRVEEEARPVDEHADALQAQRHALHDRGNRARRDHTAAVWVDADRGAGHDRAEVERPRHGRHRDREPVWRAVVGAGEEDRAGESVRFGPGADGDRRRADLAARRASAGLRLRFAAERDRGDRADEAGRQHRPDLREVLLPVRSASG